MDCALRLHLQSAPPGCPRGRQLSHVVYQLWHSHAFGGEYLELIPAALLRYTDKFDDPNLPGELLVTVALHKVLCGTEVRITQTGIPEVIPVEMCHLGWQESLAQLATLVEPEIAGG
jgi:uncharacterized protein YndB with AHSA1/START domain